MKIVNEENLKNIDFEKGYGLIPTIIQDISNNEILMMSYMNRESLEKTLETGTTWFFSPSENTICNKGETSNSIQKVISVYMDCDGDTLLIKVEQDGVTCHTGNKSCFYKVIAE